MTPEETINGWLSGASGLTTIVGSRIFHGALPADADLPAVIFQIESDPITTIHGTVLGQRDRVEIQGHAATATQAADICDAVVLALMANGQPWERVARALNVPETGNYFSSVGAVL